MEIQKGDDGSDYSPMPLNISPPEPTNVRGFRHFHENLLSADHDSVSAALSLPEPPSNYSPPPSSVFSEEELPIRSTRKSRPPLQEVHVEESSRPRDFSTPHTTSHLQTPSAMHILTPTTTSPDFVVPAIKSLKINLQESHQSLYLLQEENKSLTAECQKFEAFVDEQRQTIQQLQAEVASQKDDHAAALLELQVEKEALASQHAALLVEVKSMEHVQYKLAAVVKEKEKLQQTMDRAMAESQVALDQLQSEKEQLEMQAKAATERADFAESQRQELATQVEVLLGDKQQSEAQREQQEQNYIALQQENVALKSSLSESERQRNKSAAQAEQTISELRHQIERLSSEIETSNTANNTLVMELAAIKKELSEKNHAVTETACQTTIECVDAAVQTARVIKDHSSWPLGCSSFASTHAPDPLGMSERIGRIRDAAERAAVLQDVRREVSRLKLEHESELRKLETEHEVALRKVIQEAKTELRTKVDKHKERLKSEYEAKLQALETSHQAELDDVREECERMVRVSEETVQAAVSEVESAMRQLEAERLRSSELEERLMDIGLRQEDGRLKVSTEADELTALKDDWKNDTAILLERIRGAFEDHIAERIRGDDMLPGSKSFPPFALKHNAAILSPLSVNDSAFLSSPHSAPGDVGAKVGRHFFSDQNVFRPSAGDVTNASAIRPLTSKSALLHSSANLDKTLAETEAMVMRLLRTD